MSVLQESICKHYVAHRKSNLLTIVIRKSEKSKSYLANLRRSYAGFTPRDYNMSDLYMQSLTYYISACNFFSPMTCRKPILGL